MVSPSIVLSTSSQTEDLLSAGADGALQEEISAVYKCLGAGVFNIMVIIATNSKGEKYQIQLTDEDTRITKEVFTAAYQKATGHHLPNCPPILYLPFKETDAMKLVEGVDVMTYAPVRLTAHNFVPKYHITWRIWRGNAYIPVLGIVALIGWWWCGALVLPWGIAALIGWWCFTRLILPWFSRNL